MLGWLGYLGVAVTAMLAAFLIGRVVLTRGGPDLEPWHTFLPAEPDPGTLDRLDWSGYLAAEANVLAAVESEITDRLPAHDRLPVNRFFKGSPVHRSRLVHDWNRSFVLEPKRRPVGGAVLLHGLTDSPYSLRHVAEVYRANGWLALAIRLPGHGTAPAALTRVGRRSWAAATGLAIREVRRRVGEAAPLHVVGYSNGAALALDHVLRAVDDPVLERATRLVMLSPMIGITTAARFAGMAGWPAVVPRWARTAWIKIRPEYNPFKYNSLPVNAARQSHLITRELQRRLDRLQKSGRLGELPPLLTFQSVVDATVLTDALIHRLHGRLSAGTSELVLFDINRSVHFGHLIRPKAARSPESLLPPAPRGFRSTIVTNRDPTTSDVVERVTETGSVTSSERELHLAFPPGVYSLSHIALPFPLSDSLYGLEPEPPEAFGVSLGVMATKGERGVLAVADDEFTRLTANPFFAYLGRRLEAAMDEDAPRA